MSLADIKLLWGRAAGICSRPGCGEDCIKYVQSNKPFSIGEMAHIIDKKPKGRRSKKYGGNFSYDNTILLCPNCHRIVDKAPHGTYSIKNLHKWKTDHESRRKKLYLSPIYTSKLNACKAINQILEENYQIWKTFGPDSKAAKQNPTSNLVEIWNLRKLSTLVPNNRKIINIIEVNKSIWQIDDYRICIKFIEHAEGFERNCYDRTENLPRFPLQFERMIHKYAKC